jgi:sugar phosphate isomerase/epimerase
MIALGASTLGFRHNTLDEALQAIHSQGFRHIDICAYPSYCPHVNPLTATASEIQTLKAKLSDSGMTVAAINAGDGSFGVPGQHERAIHFSKAGCLCHHHSIRL